MAEITKVCMDEDNSATTLRVTFNKEAGTATLHGSWGVSSSGYSYAATAEQRGEELHVKLDVIPPDGAALCVMCNIDINSAFSAAADTKKVVVHVNDYAELKLQCKLAA